MGKEGSKRFAIRSGCVDEAVTARESYRNRLRGNWVFWENSTCSRRWKGDGHMLGGQRAPSLGRRRGLSHKRLRMVAFVVVSMGLFSLFDSVVVSLAHQWLAPRGFGIGRDLQVSCKKLTLLDCSKGEVSSLRGIGINEAGYVLVSANGGLNQQRVAICNAVAVSVLLNASLVLPGFLYSNIWKDHRQTERGIVVLVVYTDDLIITGDDKVRIIEVKRFLAEQFVMDLGQVGYFLGIEVARSKQEDYFINYLKEDVNIVKELPAHLQSLDFEAIGSQITDMDIMKESAPDDFIRAAHLPLRRNGVVHFLGFGNRLGFDLPPHLQRLRCKCNFHALKFVPKIQEVGSLLIRRIRNYNLRRTELNRQLLGAHLHGIPMRSSNTSKRPSKYLALHLRFEMDMVAYSLCDFGGGVHEKEELQVHREVHFPRLVKGTMNNSVSPEELRSAGKCPLTPEEVALVLSAVGFKSETYVYLAGSHVYGGQSRLLPLSRLFPNMVTKEDLLTRRELVPFANHFSQLAALDFIACAAADVFAMSDSGSQLSSIVSGYRVYHGEGRYPRVRPNKKVLAEILSKSGSIRWDEFVDRVKAMIKDDQQVRARLRGRSIYRQPRTPGCICEL